MQFSRLATLLVLVLLVIYGLVKGFPILSGPDIVIDTPAPYATLQSHELVLTGTAVRTDTLLLNDAVLLIDENGRFSTSLTLPSGGAILSLTARDRFGRSITERLSVFVP